MANTSRSYQDYLALGYEGNLRLLNRADELPQNIDQQVLWQCLITGQIFARSFSVIRTNLRAGQYASPGQHYVAKHLEDYYRLAEELGLQFLYDPQQDYAPYSTRAPVKWRGRNGVVVVAEYHQLAYNKINKMLQRALGLGPEIATDPAW